jgi:hypothetical protein
VKNILSFLSERLSSSGVDRDVHEELEFHIEQRARGLEREGFSAAESRALAEERFGDFEKIKKQCVRIAVQRSMGLFTMKMIFMAIFLLGVFVRSLTIDFRVNRVGTLLMAIAVLGGILLYGKKLGATRDAPKDQALKLGLMSGANPIPRSFDEQGRTPFDRVRNDG